MALHAQEKSSTIHVLLLEDNPGDVLLIKAMLRKQRGTTYLLQREDSTEGGLTTLRTQPVDVVLLDLGLIDSKGIETLIVMQKHHRDIPMVVMTGMDDELLATEAVRQGAQDFLVKGKFDGYWLHRVIDNAIQRKELEHSLHILAQFPDNNPNPVLRISEDGQVLYANKASEQLCALCDCYVNHYVQETWREWLRQAAVMKKSTTHEQELASSFFRFQIVPLPGSRQFYLYAEDITKQKRAEQQLQHSAQHDVLTNLPNRKFLLETLAQTLTQKHMMRPFAVLFLDVDRFKRVNDGLGHAVGDILLIQFAERIGKGLRDSDIVARLGGDEFVILLRDLHGPQDAIRVAERIQQALEAPFQLEGHTLFVTTSIGIAFGHQAS
ncbi:MAG TPA: hypothetical protein DCE42_18190, partial [Myxococcales bacterium]|nr:hypothetical protein [Myxococcales bacterium]